MSLLLSVLQLGIQFHLTKMQVEEKSEETVQYIKSSAIQIAVIFLSLMMLMVAVVLYFVELGNQWNAADAFHLSGMVRSVLILGGLSLSMLSGALIFGPKRLPKRETESVRDPLLFITDELLKEVAQRTQARAEDSVQGQVAVKKVRRSPTRERSHPTGH